MRPSQMPAIAAASLLARPLERFLRQRHPDARVGSLTWVRSRWQTEVHRFSLEAGGVSLDCLLRLYTGVDTGRRCSRESELLRGLRRVGFGVPELTAHCLDPIVLGQPFQVVSHIPGSTMAQVMADGVSDRREGWLQRCAALLAALHALDVKQLLPASDPALSCPPPVFFARLLEDARSVLLRACKLPEFAPVLDWLESELATVRWTPPVLNHNDVHPGNIVCGADGRDYLLDWTDFGVTDYRHDLGWTLMLARAYLGRAGRDVLLAAYEQARGRPVEQIGLFEVTAALRRLHLRGLPVYAASGAIGLRAGLRMNEPMEAQHLRAVYALIPELTGLRVPAVERSLHAL